MTKLKFNFIFLVSLRLENDIRVIIQQMNTDLEQLKNSVAGNDASQVK